MWPLSVKIDQSAHLQGIKTCWRERWLKCSSLHRIAAWKSAEWEFSSPLLLAQCALDAHLLPACISHVWFAWGANRQGTSLCPTFSFFPLGWLSASLAAVQMQSHYVAKRAKKKAPWGLSCTMWTSAKRMAFTHWDPESGTPDMSITGVGYVLIKYPN